MIPFTPLGRNTEAVQAFAAGLGYNLRAFFVVRGVPECEASRIQRTSHDRPHERGADRAPAFQRSRPRRAPAQGPGRRRLRVAFAHPGRDHPPPAGRQGRAGPGPDRHRQDRRLRPAPAGKAGPGGELAPGPGAVPHPRTGHPGRRGLPEVRRPPARLPGAADLRRPGLWPAAAGPAPRRARRGRHPRPHHRPPRQGLARPLAPAHPGAGRSRRNAAHGLHRRRRGHPQEDAGRAPDGAVLGDHAARHPPHRPDLPQGTGRSNDRGQDPHRRQHPPAQLGSQRHAQARRAYPHPRSRTLRRHDRFRPHQAGHRRTG